MVKIKFGICGVIVGLAVAVSCLFFMVGCIVLWIELRDISQGYLYQVAQDVEDYLDEKGRLLDWLVRLWNGREIQDEWDLKKAVLSLSLMDPMIEEVGIRFPDKCVLSSPYEDRNLMEELFLVDGPVFWEEGENRGIWIVKHIDGIVPFMRLGDIALWSVFLPILDRKTAVEFAIYDVSNRCVLESGDGVGRNSFFTLTTHIGDTGWQLIMDYSKEMYSALGIVAIGSLFLGGLIILVCCLGLKRIRNREMAVGELIEWVRDIERRGDVVRQVNSDSFLQKEFPNVVQVIMRLLQRIKDYEERSSIWAVGRAIRWVSHEVKNRLVPVKSFVQVAMSQGTIKGESMKKLAELALAQLSQCENVIAKLSVLRPDIPITLENVDVCSMLYEVAESFQMLVFDKNVDIEIFCDKGLTFPLDKEKVMMALNNLILNSIEAIEGSGRIRLFAYRLNYGLTLEVEDNGCGIPEEIKRRLFEPFVSTKVNTDEPAYRGIGLAIVYNIVIAHGGKVSVESVKGRTSCKLWFPLNRIKQDKE